MAKRNKISVNAKYYKGARIERIADHNNRIDRINYLLEKIHHTHKNINIVYNTSGDLVNKKFKFTPGNYLMQKFENNQLNLSNENNSNLLKMEFYRLQQIKEQIQREKKSYTKPNENNIFEMVVALSEEQALDYLNSGIDLMPGFDMYMKDLQDKYGFTPVGVSLHLDEGYINEKGVVKKNIHAHLVCFNYDFEKGKSVLRNLRKKDFQDMQTMAQDSFQKVGLNFVRGNKKTIAGKDHLERNELILENQNKLILENDTTLDIQSKTLENIENNMETLTNHIHNLNLEISSGKELVKDINLKKQELKEILSSCEKGSEKYNEIYEKIGLIQIEEKESRELVKLLKLEINEKQSKLNSFENEKENLIENIKNIKTDEKAANSKLDELNKEIELKSKELSLKSSKLNEIKEDISKEEKELETIKETKKKVSIASRDDVKKNLSNRINKLFKKRIKQTIINGNEYLKLDEKELESFKNEIFEEFKDLSNFEFIVEDSKKTKLENFDLKARIINLENDNKELELKSNAWIDKWKEDNQKLAKVEKDLETHKKAAIKDSNEIRTLKSDKESLTKQNNKAIKFIKNKGFEDEFEESKTHHIGD